MPVHRAFSIVIFLSALLFTACKTGTDYPVPDYPQIVIDTFTANNTNESNTYLTLIDSEGNTIAEDDNGNPDQVNHKGCSRINYQGGLTAGTYYVKVQHPFEATVTSPYYGIRALDYDPGSSFPGFSGVDETDGGTDDGVNGNGVPINPKPIGLGQVIDDRAIFPTETDVDWFELVLP